MSENITIPGITSKTLQTIVAYLSIVFGVLTTQLQSIHLPVLASAILGAFGVLLHPQTSITAPQQTATGGTSTKTPTVP